MEDVSKFDKEKIIKYFKIIAELTIFLVAIFFIHKELKKYSLHDLRSSIEAIPFWAITLIIFFVCLDYLILTCFDILAFKNENYSLPKKNIGFVAFVSFAFANSIGLSGLTASGLRLNLYSILGVPYKTIMNVVVFCYITFWLGLLWIGGIFLTLLPISLVDIKLPIKLPIDTTVPIGVILLIGAIIFTGAIIKKHKNTNEILLNRILIALADWVSLSFVLYFALPPHNRVDFFHFLAIFIIAQILGFLSNVPGGVGVFDLIFLTLLGSVYSSDKIIGALLVYRIAYFFIPLLVAFTIFTIYHLFIRKDNTKITEMEKIIFSQFPNFLSIIITLSGIVLIFSGFFPFSSNLITKIEVVFPFLSLETSHFIGAAIGTALLFLAYYIQNRFELAYFLSIIFLGCSVILSILKEFHLFFIFFLTLTFIGTIPTKKYFYRKSRKTLQEDNLVTDKDLKKCISLSSSTDAYLSLLGDKEMIFDDSKKSFIMFGKSGHSFVAMGDPIGDEQTFGSCIWKFYNHCKVNKKETVFYEVNKNYLNYYLDVGLSFLKIGEFAQVHLEEFTLDGSNAKALRHAFNRVEKEGYTFEVIPVEKVSEILDDLESISNEWLQDKNAKEKGFSLGKFTKEYLLNFPVGVIKKDNKILAFGNILETDNKEEISLDLMRYRNVAVHGTMDYFFICVINYGKENGFKKFNLGMAPLAGIEDNTASFWNKIERAIFSHGEHFYNFKGLRTFKDKFNPQWEPRYIAYSGPFNLPNILKDITLLISGGIRGLISKK
ncbi:MAG: phosphatidylglycerol lysyltransferase domain-containing protein [Cetobacterium sp.]|uniref:phosphatidylglycerol lysyltransferase domain-containing protein n=1 Tax=Cetobacterium sp. TaxID=2071632 RepID=UPI003F317ACE